jgi:hypothetical protein
MGKKGKLWNVRSIFGKTSPPVPAGTTRYYGRSIMDDIADEEEERLSGPLTVTYGRKQPWLDSYPKSIIQTKADRKAFSNNKNGVTYPRNHSANRWDESYGTVARTTTYVAPVKKKEYIYSASEWSNYNFYYSSYYTTDNDDNLIVKSPESYLTPTNSQIQAKMAVYSQEKINRIKEMARVCYFKMIDEKEYLDEDYANGNKSFPFSSDEYVRRLAIFQNIFETFVPGFTPLEQAIFIHYKLEDEDAMKRSSDKRGCGAVNFTFKREEYADPAINCQLEMNELSKDKKIEILNKMSLIGNFGSEFMVAKETGERLVANSNVFRKNIMREYSQFNQIELYQRMFPNFRTKFLTKDLIVTVPVSLSEKKQILICLLDFSGSMRDDKKQLWVNAFLIDRFKYVIKGEAEIYFSYFVSSPEQLKFTHIKNKKDVEEFWKTMSNNPNGSVTDMGRIVNYVSDQVKAGKLHNLNVDLRKQEPEILIINDGQDRVGHDKFPYKVNALSLMQYSPELKGLCVATGGKQVTINEKDEVNFYSKEGKTKIER